MFTACKTLNAVTFFKEVDCSRFIKCEKSFSEAKRHIVLTAVQSLPPMTPKFASDSRFDCPKVKWLLQLRLRRCNQ